MINMKLPKRTKKEIEAMNRPIMDDGEKYPYGLKINLGTDEIKKLGLDIGTLKVEQIGEIKAKIKVVDLRSHESARPDSSSEHVELQITDMEISLSSSKPKSDKFSKYNAGLSSIGGMAE